MECGWNADVVRTERGLSANGVRIEREWSANLCCLVYTRAFMYLSGETLVDSLVKHTPRGEGSEFLLVLLEDLNVVIS